jgi:transcriptional regulator with XRE-family HTH domain
MGLLQNWMSENEMKDDVLAEKVEVSRVQVLRWRLRQNRPSPKRARKLEKVTGIPAGDLMMDTADQ